MPEALGDLMAWFFGTDEETAINDAMFAKLTEARAADATFDDLIALIP